MPNSNTVVTSGAINYLEVNAKILKDLGDKGPSASAWWTLAIVAVGILCQIATELIRINELTAFKISGKWPNYK